MCCEVVVHHVVAVPNDVAEPNLELESFKGFIFNVLLSLQKRSDGCQIHTGMALRTLASYTVVTEAMKHLRI